MLALFAVDDETADTLENAFQICFPGDFTCRANSAKQCLDLLKEKNPDIVILDINLKHDDCYETIRQIRKAGNVPILAMSYLNDESQIVRALDSGANDYVVKPVRQLETVARIRTLLRQRQPGREKKNKA